MALKTYKPTSAGIRHKTCLTFDEITTTTPEKSLLKPHRKSGGRNVNGRITARHQGGGHKNAAGCTLIGSLPEVRERVFGEIRRVFTVTGDESADGKG